MDEIRIYVSAATGELGAERALLAEVVLPRLRERAAAAGRGIAWELVDPEARAAAWSLKDRLRAIDGCPLFVAFVGERLGPPLPPPQADLLRRYPWLADLAGASLGEAEIVHGALVDRPARRSFLYLRAPDLPVPPRERLRFRAATREEAERLGELKEGLRAAGRPLLDGYAGRWDPAARRIAGLEALADRLVDDLWAAARDAPAAGTGPSPPAKPEAPRPRAASPRTTPGQDAEGTPQDAEPGPADATVPEAPPAFVAPFPPSVAQPAAMDAKATAPEAGAEPEVAGEDDIPPLPPRAGRDEPDLPPRRDGAEPAPRALGAPPPAPNPLVGSLPPLRGAPSPSGRWLAIAVLILALAALALWLVLRH
jgi:hypothetical protein